MTRQDILNSYKVDKHGIIRSLGKFEAEMLYAPHFYDSTLDGCAEELSFMDDDGMGEYAALVQVTDEDRAMFPELEKDTAYVLVTQSEQGFVGCQELTVEKADKVRTEYESAQEQEEEIED